MGWYAYSRTQGLHMSSTSSNSFRHGNKQNRGERRDKINAQLLLVSACYFHQWDKLTGSFP